MNKAVETIGWPSPKGKCDMCGERASSAGRW